MSISDKKKSFMDTVNQHLDIISEKSGVDAKLVVLALGICCFFVFIGYFDYYITQAVGILYPAFWSIRAIESKESDDDKQWLTYWVVFACFSIVDLFSGFILKFIPFYFFMKIIFLIYLAMPNFRGATFVYDHFLIKIFKKYESSIENFGKNLSKKSETVIEKGKQVIKDNQGNIIQAGVNVTSKVVEATKSE